MSKVDRRRTIPLPSPFLPRVPVSNLESTESDKHIKYWKWSRNLEHNFNLHETTVQDKCSLTTTTGVRWERSLEQTKERSRLNGDPSQEDNPIATPSSPCKSVWEDPSRDL